MFNGVITVVCAVVGGGDASLFVRGGGVVDDGVPFFYGGLCIYQIVKLHMFGVEDQV